MFNMVEDMASLTGIPPNTLINLFNVMSACICEDVLETTIQGEKDTLIDMGFATLSVGQYDDNIKLKITPKKSLEDSLIKSVNGEYLLTEKLENSLSAKIRNTYKELL